MTLHEALEKFIREKCIEGVQKTSLKNYRVTLHLFIDYVGSNLPLSDLSFELVQDYILSLQERDLSRNTVRSYVRNIKIFLQWCDGYERLQFGTKRIKKPRGTQKHLPIYTLAQWNMIKAACKTYIPWITLRNIAILSVLADCGIRRKEIVSMKRSDFFYEDGRLFAIVHGKGNKDRPIAIGHEAFSKINAYLEACPYKTVDFLFLTKTGTPITLDTVSQFCSVVQKKLCFPFSAHILRHNYATLVAEKHYIEHGETDLETLQIYLGHESLDTTKRYIHLAKQHLNSKKAISLLDENLFCVADEAHADGNVFDTSVFPFVSSL